MRGHYQRISPKFTFLVQCFAIASYLADDQGSFVRKMAKKTRRVMGEKPSSCTTYMETVASTSGQVVSFESPCTIFFFFYTPSSAKAKLQSKTPFLNFKILDQMICTYFKMK